MIIIDQWIMKADMPVKMIMQVHDELVFEVPTSSIESVVPQVVSHMTAAGELTVPLEVDANVGLNWDQAH